MLKGLIRAMQSNEMRTLPLLLLIGFLLSCQKTDNPNQADEIAQQEAHPPEQEAYAKAFVEKAQRSQGLLLPGMGTLVANKQAAIAVAEAVLFAVYGEENIKGQRPYAVYKTSHYWVLTGTLPEGSRGGVFEIAIDAHNAGVIGLTHGK